MKTITVHSHVGSDGSLKLELPAELRESDVIVTVTAAEKTEARGGWSPGFFEATAGQWQGEPLVRETQSEWETRGVVL